jgi:hypothetical protein
MDSIIDDLRIEAASPPRSLRPGTALPVTLTFINMGGNTRTLFFIGSETYRFGQSTFRFRTRSEPTQVQPMARDGYVPSDADFHTLEPHGRLVFQQALTLARTTPVGNLTVEWTYQNAMECYPSKMSNRGELIPGIWRGRLVHNFTVKVTKS